MMLYLCPRLGVHLLSSVLAESICLKESGEGNNEDYRNQGLSDQIRQSRRKRCGVWGVSILGRGLADRITDREPDVGLSKVCACAHFVDGAWTRPLCH